MSVKCWPAARTATSAWPGIQANQESFGSHLCDSLRLNAPLRIELKPQAVAPYSEAKHRCLVAALQATEQLDALVTARLSRKERLQAAVSEADGRPQAREQSPHRLFAQAQALGTRPLLSGS